MTPDEFAKKNGFLRAEKLIKWGRYQTYEAIYSEPGLDDAPAIGYPQIILESKNGALRMAETGEIELIIDAVQSEE